MSVDKHIRWEEDEKDDDRPTKRAHTNRGNKGESDTDDEEEEGDACEHEEGDNEGEAAAEEEEEVQEETVGAEGGAQGAGHRQRIPSTHARPVLDDTLERSAQITPWELVHKTVVAVVKSLENNPEPFSFLQGRTVPRTQYDRLIEMLLQVSTSSILARPVRSESNPDEGKDVEEQKTVGAEGGAQEAGTTQCGTSTEVRELLEIMLMLIAQIENGVTPSELVHMTVVAVVLCIRNNPELFSFLYGLPVPRTQYNLLIERLLLRVAHFAARLVLARPLSSP